MICMPFLSFSCKYVDYFILFAQFCNKEYLSVIKTCISTSVIFHLHFLQDFKPSLNRQRRTTCFSMSTFGSFLSLLKKISSCGQIIDADMNLDYDGLMFSLSLKVITVH